MAQLPQIRRIYTEDVINSDGTINSERLLYSINLFIENTYNILDRGITYDNNIDSQTAELTFKTSSLYTSAKQFNKVTFLIAMGGKPIGCEILNIVDVSTNHQIITDPVSLAWSVNKQSIVIDFVAGLKDSTSYKMTVRLT